MNLRYQGRKIMRWKYGSICKFFEDLNDSTDFPNADLNQICIKFKTEIRKIKNIGEHEKNIS